MKMEAMVIDKPKTQSPKSRQSTLKHCTKSGLLSYSFKNSINVSRRASTPIENILDESSGGLNKIEVSRGQKRLDELAGVVKIDQLNAYIRKLKDPSVSTDEKIDIILQLQEKSPSTKIIQSTGIGILVRSMAKDKQDQENFESVKLMKESKKLYRQWKRLVEKRVDNNLVSTMKNLNITERQNHIKKLEQACIDCVTTHCNETGDQSRLSVSKPIVNRMEHYVFNLTGKFIGSYYRRLMQKIIIDVRDNNSGLFQKIFIFNGKLRLLETGYDKISKGARVDDILKEHLSEYLLESV